MARHAPAPAAELANRPDTPSAPPGAPPVRIAARPYIIPRAAAAPGEGISPASIAWRASSCGALNATYSAATETHGLTMWLPNDPPGVEGDAPITANNAKHSAHTTGQSRTPISDCSTVRASHDVSGNGHSAIANGAATNSNAGNRSEEHTSELQSHENP